MDITIDEEIRQEHLDFAPAVLDAAHIGDITGAMGTISMHDRTPRRTWKHRLLTLVAILGPATSTFATRRSPIGAMISSAEPVTVPVGAALLRTRHSSSLPPVGHRSLSSTPAVARSGASSAWTSWRP